MDAFLELFGEINVATIVTYLIALGFVAATYRKFKSYLIEKNDTEKVKDKKLEDVIAAVSDIVKHMDKNIKMQENLTEQVEELKERLDRMESEQTTRAKNNIRDKLIKYYQHYTNPETNPTLSWTEMEHHSYRELLQDYTNAGGNDYIHRVVEPAMDKLTIIKIE